jgi:hypothetical protein
LVRSAFGSIRLLTLPRFHTTVAVLKNAAVFDFGVSLGGLQIAAGFARDF